MDREISFQKQARCRNYYTRLNKHIDQSLQGELDSFHWLKPSINHGQSHIRFQNSWLVTLLTLWVSIVKQLLKSLVSQDVRISMYTLILLLQDTVLHVIKLAYSSFSSAYPFPSPQNIDNASVKHFYFNLDLKNVNYTEASRTWD